MEQDRYDALWAPDWYHGGRIEPGQVATAPNLRIFAALDYFDRAYGTRWSRAKRHLRLAWSELRAALAEYRRSEIEREL